MFNGDESQVKMQCKEMGFWALGGNVWVKFRELASRRHAYCKNWTLFEFVAI